MINTTFSVPPLRICQKYGKDIAEMEREFKKTTASAHIKPILISYLQNRYAYSKSHSLRISLFFPFWLSEGSSISSKIVNSVALSMAYHMEYLLIQDSMLDERLSRQQLHSSLILGNFFQLKSNELLCPVFNKNLYFWKLYNKYHEEYVDTLRWEQEFCSKINEWSKRDILMLGKKLSPMKMVSTGFAILSNKKSQIKKLEKAIEYFHIAMQMLDDLDDWREDLKKTHFTYFLTKCSHDRSILTRSHLYQNIPKSALLSTLDVSLRYLEKTKNVMDGLPQKSFQEFISILTSAVTNAYLQCEKNPKDLLHYGPNRLLKANMTFEIPYC